MRAYFEPAGVVLIDCPRCGDWIDADAEAHECGWTIYGDEYEANYAEEEWNSNVQESGHENRVHDSQVVDYSRPDPTRPSRHINIDLETAETRVSQWLADTEE